MKPGRVPCINPRCRRTAPAEKYEPGAEIICGGCFRALPARLRKRYRQLRGRERRLLRLIDQRLAKGAITVDIIGRLEKAHEARAEACWTNIRRSVTAPDAPAGLDSFLETVGLA